MDPDECLAIIRKAIADEAPYDALEAMQDLDEWISKGGFLPKVWRGTPAVALIQWDNGPTVFGPFIDLESAARFITNVVAPTHKTYVLPLNMLHPSEYQEWDNEGESDDDDGS